MKNLLILLMVPVFMFGQTNIKTAPWKAMGNGLSDDTVAINSTIDAVAQSGGGTVYCPSGNYVVSSPIKWTSSDIYLQGDGGCNIIPSSDFKGEAVIMVGHASATLSPTYRGGIDNIHVDMSRTSNPDLIGTELIQAWFTVIDKLRITQINGLPTPRQTAFQISSGELPNGGWMVNWTSNISVRDLQISGSFLNTVRHVSGCSATATNCYGMVNGTIYSAGFGFNTSANKAGSYGFRIDSGDSTKVYGFALEDYDTAVYVGTQNNGPFDFRFEGCNTRFQFGSGQSATINYLDSINSDITQGNIIFDNTNK